MASLKEVLKMLILQNQQSKNNMQTYQAYREFRLYLAEIIGQL